MKLDHQAKRQSAYVDPGTKGGTIHWPPRSTHAPQASATTKSKLMPSVSTSWNRILEWLRANAPKALEEIQGPASPKQLDRAASRMNASFPNDFCAFYRIADGAEESGIFPSNDDWDDMAFSPAPLEQVIADWKMQKELLDMGEFADRAPQSAAGIAGDWWNVGWIPFANNGGGDYYCVDLAPTDGGAKGQIISHSHESGEHRVLASSLEEYLANLADLLESNEFEYDDDYGVRKIASDE